MFRNRKPEPAEQSNQRLSMDVEDVITRVNAAVDRFDVVYDRLLPLVDALTVKPKGDRGGGNPAGKPGLAH